MIRSIPRLAAVAAVASFAAACAMPPKPISVSDVVEASATVEAIDPATRRVRLMGADGRARIVQAGAGVRNFEQVRVGDRVVVRFTEAIGAEVVAPTSAVGSTQPTVSAERSVAGARPGASEAISLKGVVKVVSVDAEKGVVEFVGVDGAMRRVRVVDPRAQAFVRGLKSGDAVQITFTEAIALSVEPAR
jgi:hypothetical protein